MAQDVPWLQVPHSSLLHNRSSLQPHFVGFVENGSAILKGDQILFSFMPGAVHELERKTDSDGSRAQRRHKQTSRSSSISTTIDPQTHTHPVRRSSTLSIHVERLLRPLLHLPCVAALWLLLVHILLHRNPMVRPETHVLRQSPFREDSDPVN